jgi:hypothetical protein
MIVNIDLPCQALDQDGNMCGKQSWHSIDYHGDSEIYYYTFGWVKVNLCKEHYAMIKRINVDEIKS